MIELFTAPTPNGFKISIALEELEISYTVSPIDLAASEQKQHWFREINPNGRIPAIVDHDNNRFRVFESGAILLYLARRAGRLVPSDPDDESVALQWLMFQAEGSGPMMGQARAFHHYSEQKVPYAIQRCRNEVRRMFDVLNTHLAHHEYLADEYSIADIANFPWVTSHSGSGVSIDEFSHLQRWLNTISKRTAVIRGLRVPDRSRNLAASGEKES